MCWLALAKPHVVSTCNSVQNYAHLETHREIKTPHKYDTFTSVNYDCREA